jgi:antibiotic biosynthesis monooxygenase (ABM) superfamily enzyme
MSRKQTHPADPEAGPVGGVTLVSAVRLRPGTEKDHRRLHDEAVEQARALGGLLRAELVPAIPGVQPETVALLTYEDRRALDRWLAADERTRALKEMEALCEGERTLTVLGDFAGWFSGPNSAHPRHWKQALVVFAGLVPVALLGAFAREQLAPDLPLAVSVALVSAWNVVLLTWVVMPTLTRALRGWLSD